MVLYLGTFHNPGHVKANRRILRMGGRYQQAQTYPRHSAKIFKVGGKQPFTKDIVEIGMQNPFARVIT